MISDFGNEQPQSDVAAVSAANEWFTVGGIGSKFSNLKIGNKIYTGFGIVLAILMVLGGVAIFQIMHLGSSFEEYTDVADNAVLVTELEGNIVKLGSAIRTFSASDSAENLAKARDIFGHARREISKAEESIHDPGRLKIMREIDELAVEYGRGFEEMVLLIRKRHELVYQVLNVIGPGIQKKLTEINELAYADKDFRTANYAGVAQRDFLLARLYVAMFLDTSETAAIQRVRDEFKLVEGGLRKLDLSLEDYDLRQLLGTVVGEFPAFEEALEDLVHITGELNRIRANVLDRDATAIEEKIAKIKLAEHEEEAALQQDTHDTVSSAEIEAGLIAAAALGLGVLIAFFIVRSIAVPVVSLTQIMLKLAEGDKTVIVSGVERQDEIGEMAKTVEFFKQNSLEMDRMRVENEKAERIAREKERAAEKRKAEEAAAVEAKAAEDKKRAMNELADAFEASVSEVVHGVSSAAEEMQSTAKSMTATAKDTGDKSSVVAAASEQASVNVQTVAATTEELSVSIEEISRQVTKSRDIAGDALLEVENSSATVRKLAEAAQKIGDVVNLITEIANQTNLLALNATIEAARAGDSGRGFAVVASEVKTLANETAKATEEIAGQVNAIQGESAGTVKAIGNIHEIVKQLDEISASVASAVEEQTAATSEISRSIQEAAIGTQEVSDTIGAVNQAAQETGQGAGQVLDAAGMLARQADAMGNEVQKFLETVRTA